MARQIRCGLRPPRKIVIVPLRSYPAAKAGIPELANLKHEFVKAAARVNKRAESRRQPSAVSRQPTREREQRMRELRDPACSRAFLASFGLIRQHFALKRHLLRASPYRQHLAVRFSAWRELAEAPRIRLPHETGRSKSRSWWTYSANVTKPQKVLAADALILLFPLWWYGMPAIMKGWIGRVWAYGYRRAGNACRHAGFTKIDASTLHCLNKST